MAKKTAFVPIPSTEVTVDSLFLLLVVEEVTEVTITTGGILVALAVATGGILATLAVAGGILVALAVATGGVHATLAVA